MSSNAGDACPAWLLRMGQADSDPLEACVSDFVRDKEYWGAEPEAAAASRDSRAMNFTASRTATREKMVPRQFANRFDAWGGGLRRMVVGDVGPRREDEHHYAARHVPVGFADYISPHVNPADYVFHNISGWRVAVPRKTHGVQVGDLLRRIYNYGPGSAGYARHGDTLVPAVLGPGDRHTLAGTETLGNIYA